MKELGGVNADAPAFDRVGELMTEMCSHVRDEEDNRQGPPGEEDRSDPAAPLRPAHLARQQAACPREQASWTVSGTP
ncbi:hypothetical protein SSOG_02405 [Streptomyces himastatinicus ATCC 53653]|uniref:Uncharacterized protein n=1 Tax=Streptomyces himastatinicus ATCC 53653 TaxID=457427 RepID=D9W8I4_9ACTN|nr:hypothetical protein SSOG_02405 [Streptomyces himastatinicus ATCC 53653]